MTALTVPFVVIGVAVTVPVFAFGVRRLLGLRVSPLRWVIGGIVALAFASPIITAIGLDRQAQRQMAVPAGRVVRDPRGGDRAVARDARIGHLRGAGTEWDDAGTAVLDPRAAQARAADPPLLADHHIEELSGLQDDAAQVPWLEVQQVLRSELGADVDDVSRASIAAHSRPPRSRKCTLRCSTPVSGSS
jgi:hypothetical protein